jgi:hypothetical protein
MPLARQLSNLTADQTSLSRLRLVSEASARIGCNFCQLLSVFTPAITAPDFEEHKVWLLSREVHWPNTRGVS